MAISTMEAIQNMYLSAMRYTQDQYANSDPGLNVYMQQQLMNQSYSAAYYNQASMMQNISMKQQEEYIKHQMSRMQQEYEYVHKRYEGPTQRELDRNPSLRDAWEQYLIVKELSK